MMMMIIIEKRYQNQDVGENKKEGRKDKEREHDSK